MDVKVMFISSYLVSYTCFWYPCTGFFDVVRDNPVLAPPTLGLRVGIFDVDGDN